MIRASSSCIGGCIFALLIAFCSVPCHAQQKYSYSHSTPPDTSKYVRDYSIEVDDIPGHKIRIFEAQRTYTKDQPMIMGAKVVETWFRGATDYGTTGGPGHGYGTWILEDGSKVFLEEVFTSSIETTDTGSRRGTTHGTARFVGGTGKYVSIHGSISSSTEFDTDPKTGYNRPSSRGEYWFANQ